MQLGLSIPYDDMYSRQFLSSLLLSATISLPGALGQVDGNLRTCLEKATEKSRVAWKTKFLFDLLDVKRYNQYYDTEPAAIVYPTSAEEVGAVVKCAANAKVPVQARSGGHSFGNYGRLPSVQFGFGNEL